MTGPLEQMGAEKFERPGIKIENLVGGRYAIVSRLCAEGGIAVTHVEANSKVRRCSWRVDLAVALLHRPEAWH